MASADEQKLKRIKEHRTSRRSALWFLANWSRNQSSATILMHRCLRAFTRDPSLLAEAIRNYVISMTSCLETFYRDMFTYVLEQDPAILKTVLAQVKERPSLLDMLMAKEDGISFAELAAVEFKFQNIHEVDQSLRPLFEPKGYLNSLDRYEHKCRVRGAPAKLQLPSSWRDTFAKLFHHRHCFVHDANTRYHLSGETMVRLEFVVFAVAQFTAAMVGSRFGNTGLYMFENVPYFVCVEDFMDESWAIVEDGGPGIRLEGAHRGGSGEVTAKEASDRVRQSSPESPA